METIKFEDISIYDFGKKYHMAGIILGNLIVPLPKEKLDNLKLISLSEEDWKTLLHQLDTLEVRMFPNDKSGLKKTIMRKSQRQIEPRISWNVFRRDKYRCRYCGADNVPLTVDHIILWEDMGQTIENNLITSCKQCNNTRGDMPFEEWLESDYYKLKLQACIKPGLTGIAEVMDGENRKAWELAKALPKRSAKRNR